jgi:electron-transferring-flavoprotein dehydrogenase
MNAVVNEPISPAIERVRMDVDIVCVGFGPATAGFLTTLSKQLTNADGTPAVESTTTSGMPPQVLCYERADDIGFGVSGVVTKARALRATFPDLDQAQIPMTAPVGEEKVLYLLDPIGASRRSATLRAADAMIRTFKWVLPVEHDALNLPWTPPFLHKHGGMILSMGQFMQWVGAQVQSTGTVQIWPGTPVSQALIEQNKVVGVRLLDQGVDKKGNPSDGFTPGMDIHAALTVVADGPVGAIGQQLDAHFGMPEGHHTRDWAVGMKFVVDLPEDTPLKPGTVLHTFGFPEPEIFGFFYVHPDRVASLGIFVPSWFDSPMRTAYRQLQHWMLHPYLWRYLKGGKLRSWGAKTLGESGRRGEPHLVGDGYARVGEGSGSTNVLTGSGVDEAWATGTQLAEAVLELLKAKKPFTKQNLDEAYVKRRRASWVEKEAIVAEKSRWFSKRCGARHDRHGTRRPDQRQNHTFRRSRAALETHPVHRGILSGPGVPGRNHKASCRMPGAEQLTPRRADGEGWLARDSLRRPVADVASGRAAHGRQGAGARRLRRPRRVSQPGTVREMRGEDLHRGMQRPGHHARRRRRAEFRPREMRPLRRVHLELRATLAGQS